MQHSGFFRTKCIRDITYKVFPSCGFILVVFSVGAIFVSTLAFHEPIPRQGTIVVAGLLLSFFLLFCIGFMYLYYRKHYTRATKRCGCQTRQRGERTGNNNPLRLFRHLIRRVTRHSSRSGSHHIEPQIGDILRDHAPSPNTMNRLSMAPDVQGLGVLRGPESSTYQPNTHLAQQYDHQNGPLSHVRPFDSLQQGDSKAEWHRDPRGDGAHTQAQITSPTQLGSVYSPSATRVAAQKRSAAFLGADAKVQRRPATSSASHPPSPRRYPRKPIQRPLSENPRNTKAHRAPHYNAGNPPRAPDYVSPVSPNSMRSNVEQSEWAPDVPAMRLSMRDQRKSIIEVAKYYGYPDTAVLGTNANAYAEQSSMRKQQAPQRLPISNREEPFRPGLDSELAKNRDVEGQELPNVICYTTESVNMLEAVGKQEDQEQLQAGKAVDFGLLNELENLSPPKSNPGHNPSARNRPKEPDPKYRPIRRTRDQFLAANERSKKHPATGMPSIAPIAESDVCQGRDRKPDRDIEHELQSRMRDSLRCVGSNELLAAVNQELGISTAASPGPPNPSRAGRRSSPRYAPAVPKPLNLADKNQHRDGAHAFADDAAGPSPSANPLGDNNLEMQPRIPASALPVRRRPPP
ncbi:hypothetical protein F5Y19DRAFT_491933 [Xylariaceae sp. FL1651]|nr:hypothetical protein F5Y19DRAFT_491933 [Xylariaceae sp. FL1651]